MTNFQHYYQKFNQYHNDELWFTAHSHHFWPDVSFQAIQQYWEDSARYVDNKWKHLFSSTVPKTQKILANLIGLTRPRDIAFAPNTHDLVCRLLSCLFEKEEIRILTTDSEFHSFNREILRLKEWDKVHIEQINISTAKQFVTDFKKAVQSQHFDFIYFSNVFFKTGLYIHEEHLDEVISAVPSAETLICIDGYHCFGAIPFSVTAWEDRVFFLGGSYKYLQTGEGLCFMTLPTQGKSLRPLLTGWFASFETLEDASNTAPLPYSADGMRFWGSTIDMAPFYRFNAIWETFKNDEVTIEMIHRHVEELQLYFLQNLHLEKSLLKGSYFAHQESEDNYGHFLTFVFPDRATLALTHQKLEALGIYVDYRDRFLRFGFGMQHNKKHVEKLIKLIQPF